MFKLYARNGAGSAAVEALLRFCDAPTELIIVERKPDGSLDDWFTRLNSKAEVPTLVLPDDSIMTESAAMMIHIADLYPEKGLAPPAASPQRAQYLRWMLFLATSLYMSDLHLFYPHRYTIAQADSAGIRQRAAEMMAQEYAIYADGLGDKPFMLGESLSALDIYAAMLCNWAPDIEALFARHPNIGEMYKRVTAVPSIAAVWKRNGM
jgi:glutathione S-transferase